MKAVANTNMRFAFILGKASHEGPVQARALLLTPHRHMHATSMSCYSDLQIGEESAHTRDTLHTTVWPAYLFSLLSPPKPGLNFAAEGLQGTRRDTLVASSPISGSNTLQMDNPCKLHGPRMFLAYSPSWLTSGSTLKLNTLNHSMIERTHGFSTFYPQSKPPRTCTILLPHTSKQLP